MITASSVSTADERLEVARHLRRNYTAHALEGGLFMGGMAFVHPQTVLPPIVERLGGDDWIIAAAPILLMIGFFTPSLFITHRLERISFLKPFVMWIGLLQRLPYLVVGLTLLLAPNPGSFMLPLVVLAPLSSGLAGGISVTAWREYVAKSIPPERRASLWALRFVVGGCVGVVVGRLVSHVLTHHAEARAYGILHLGVFALLTVSYGVFALTREPNLPSTRPHAETNWWNYARALRRLVATDPRLTPYLWSRALFSGLNVALPFMTLHALSTLHAPDGYLGRLLACQMSGSVVGNLLGGYLGDRRGGKVVMLLSQASSIAVSLAATRLGSARGFELLFVGLGLAVGLGRVAVPTLDFEMSSFDHRMSYQTLIGVSHLLGLLSAVAIAAGVRHVTREFDVLAWISAGMLGGSLALLARLPEPRQRAA